MLQVNNLHYTKSRHVILRGLSFKIPTHSTVALLGENGVGKTTLMRLISGLIEPNPHSDIMIDGIMGAKIKAHLSYVSTLDWANNYDRVSDIVDYFKMGYPDFNEQRMNELIKFMRIDRTRRIAKLSTGTIEKLLIALTISRDTSVYLLDEPFGGVDVIARKKIMQSLLHWLPEEATVLISTHYIQEIESLVDDAIILKDGRLLAYESVEKIRKEEGLSLEKYYTQLYIEDNGGRE